MIAALVSQVGGEDPDACDAVAALIVSLIIIVAVIPLLKGLKKTMERMRALNEGGGEDEEDDGGEGSEGAEGDKRGLLGEDGNSNIDGGGIDVKVGFEVRNGVGAGAGVRGGK